MARIAAESGVDTKVGCFCSLVQLAALVEIRITAFYEFACTNSNQSIQRRRFFGGSREFRDFTSESLLESAAVSYIQNLRRNSGLLHEAQPRRNLTVPGASPAGAVSSGSLVPAGNHAGSVVSSNYPGGPVWSHSLAS